MYHSKNFPKLKKENPENIYKLISLLLFIYFTKFELEINSIPPKIEKK